jgi:hypothetical protein
VYVDLAGTFTLSPAGELALTLTQPCRDLNAPPEGMEALTWAGGDCARTLLDRIDVVATTPWGKQVPGAWLDGEHLVFRMDWKLSGLDPLDADVPVMITRPWTICETGRCALQTPTSR